MVTPVIVESPSIPVCPQPQPKFKYQFSNNKSADAAIRFLVHHDKNGFDQLVGICVIACRGLYFPDAWAPYNASGTKMIGQDAAVREFIVGWLGKELEECKEWCSTPEVMAASPGLRYLPRRCRLALLAEIRKCPACGQRKTKECLKCGYLLSHREINKGCKTCPAVIAKDSKGESVLCGSDEFHVTCRNLCHTPSVRTSIDAACCNEDGESNSKLKDYVVAVDNTPEVLRHLEQSRPMLEDIHDCLYDLLRISFEHFEKGGQKRYLTRKLAEHFKVSLKVARKLRKEVLAAFAANLDKPCIRELYSMLERSQDPGGARLAIPMSKRTKIAMAAMREASQLLRESEKELGVKTTEPDRVPTCFDYEPPIPGEAPEVRGSTYFVSADGGAREAAAQDILEYEMQDVADEDDVRAFFGLEEGEDIAPEVDPECTDADRMGYDEDTGYTLEIDN